MQPPQAVRGIVARSLRSMAQASSGWATIRDSCNTTPWSSARKFRAVGLSGPESNITLPASAIPVPVRR